jgi:hypothetical protein
MSCFFLVRAWWCRANSVVQSFHEQPQTWKPGRIRAGGCDDLRQEAITLTGGECALAYSYRSASIGFNRAAFRAGKNPDTIPTSDRIMNEIIITPIEACRKIAPSWSVVL